jgi:TonB family protein
LPFNPRWAVLVMVGVGALADAQPASTPIDHAELTPQLTQRIWLKAFDLGQRKAAGRADRAACLVSLWYNREGTIQAAQLIRTSGFPAIDQACLAAVIGQQLKPPVLLEPERGGWTSLPINWVFTHKADVDAPLRLEPDPAIPALRTGEPMDVGAPYYPPAALAQRAHGICKMHVTVSSAGDIDSIEITQSTGSRELDQACVDALYDAPFVPARLDGRPVVGTTDVALDWRPPVPFTESEKRQLEAAGGHP